MRLVLTALCLLPLPALAIPAPRPDRAAHTVSWYRAHQQAMEQMHGLCTDDRTYENYPDCKNAAAAGDSMVRGPYGDGIPNQTSELFAKDPLRRRITLGLCNSKFPPPAATCSAARTAASLPGAVK